MTVLRCYLTGCVGAVSFAASSFAYNIYMFKFNFSDKNATLNDVITHNFPGGAMAEHRGGAGNFAENPERAAEAGRKGGQASGGNFKNSHARASEAGRKGGLVSRKGRPGGSAS